MFCHSSVCSRGGFNHGIIHVNSRFRRDARALEEEEETWFDQEDENGEEAVVMEQSDLLNDEHVFKNRKGFANEKPPPSLINNKRVSLWERWKGGSRISVRGVHIVRRKCTGNPVFIC